MFKNSIPLGTTAQNVIYILDQLGITKCDLSFKELLDIEKEIQYSDEEIYDLAKIRKIYMTNDPFNKDEWNLVNTKKWSKRIEFL